MYASVDADIMRTIVHKGRVAGRKVDGKSVGALICTKSIDSDEPENLTPAYKCLQSEKCFGLFFLFFFFFLEGSHEDVLLTAFFIAFFFF